MSIGARMQATFGVSLKKVGEEFGSRATTNTDLQKGWLYKRSKTSLGKANEDSRRHGEICTRHGRRRSRERGRGTAPWTSSARRTGCSPLIAYYLVVGGLQIPAEMSVPLLKNRFGIFYYKTRLSTVRNELVASSPALSNLFVNGVDELVGQLLLLSKRNIDGPVVRGAVVHGKDSEESVSCLEWVESVLKGEEDQIFESTANTDLEGNARELPADDVGQGSARGPGVVMENRRLNENSKREHDPLPGSARRVAWPAARPPRLPERSARQVGQPATRRGAFWISS